MNMPVLKTETAVSFPTASAGQGAGDRTEKDAVCDARARTGQGGRQQRRAAARRARARPAGVGTALPQGRRHAAAAVPVLKDTWELIVDPFFDRGGIDKGLFWHLSASLQRVALGYALAADRRRCARHAGRPIDLGDARARSDLPGAAHRAAARLAAAVAGGVPQRPAVGDLRDLHHRDLADHHQHRGRHPQHPAGLSQRREGAAAQPVRVLLQDHGAGGRALHLHRACASASACRGSRSSRPKC